MWQLTPASLPPQEETLQKRDAMESQASPTVACLGTSSMQRLPMTGARFPCGTCSLPVPQKKAFTVQNGTENRKSPRISTVIHPTPPPPGGPTISETPFIGRTNKLELNQNRTQAGVRISAFFCNSFSIWIASSPSVSYLCA